MEKANNTHQNINPDHDMYQQVKIRNTYRTKYIGPYTDCIKQQMGKGQYLISDMPWKECILYKQH